MIHANKKLRLEGGQVVLNDHQIDHPNQNNIIKFTKDKVSDQWQCTKLVTRVEHAKHPNKRFKAQNTSKPENWKFACWNINGFPTQNNRMLALKTYLLEQKPDFMFLCETFQKITSEHFFPSGIEFWTRIAMLQRGVAEVVWQRRTFAGTSTARTCTSIRKALSTQPDVIERRVRSGSGQIPLKLTVLFPGSTGS